MLEYLVEIGLAHDQAVFIRDPEAVGPQLQLSRALRPKRMGSDVTVSTLFEAPASICRFPSSPINTSEANQPATGHPVELPVHVDPGLLFGPYLAERLEGGS